MNASEDTPPSPVGVRAARGRFAGDEVDEIQRARILSAMVEVASEAGYLGAAVAPVVARAGVSRRTFYELFDGREDCFLAAFEWGIGQAREAMAEAYGSQRSWRERVRHALAALLAFFDAEPELARVCIIEALAAGRLVLERRAQVVESLTAALDADAPAGRSASAPLLTAEGIVGGALSVLHGRLLEHAHAAALAQTQDGGGEPRPLIEMHGQLMALVALPYLGPRAAGEELSRAAPPVSTREATRSSGAGNRVFERLDMRLTYRTVRCLIFIGEHPGSSNREIAQGAEIADEGQASKLLTRLTRVGLIANTKPHGPGYPNYWVLTARGQQVLGAVQAR